MTADQGSLAGWYDARALSGNILSPEEVATEVERVTLEDVIAAANTYELDTVYALIPDENQTMEETL